MTAKKASALTPPKVKHCNIIGHEQFGCSATYSERMGRWGVMNPGIVNPDALGGHWASDVDVADWADGTFPTPVQPKTDDTEGDSK